MQGLYNDKMDVQKSTSATVKNFDEQFLFPLKEADETLKGGIYFNPVDNGTYSYKAIVHTRSPTSVLTVQTLAMETYMNHISGNTSRITVVNAPFPKTFLELTGNNSVSAIFGALIFSLAFAFKFASIVSFIIRERVDSSKHQQIVSGMNIASYWFGNYSFDFFLYMLVAAITIGIAVGLDINALIEDGALDATALLFIFYGLANIPFTYILSYLFKDSGNGQSVIYFFNFLVAGIVPLIIMIFRLISNEDDPVPSGDVVRGLAWFLRLIPGFAFGEGLLNLGNR